MSAVLLSEVKLHLRVTHSFDDALLQVLLDGAEDEAKRYLGLDALPRSGAECPDCESDGSPASDADDLAPTVRIGIFMVVQAAYEGADAAEIDAIRERGFQMMRPYRCGWGV